MAVTLRNIEWSRVQAFLAVAETGSLSAAARRLGASQPTIGRQVQALEDALGTELFRRQPRGMSLTEAGEALLDPARAMQEAAMRLTLAAAGDDSALAGTVRLTSSVAVAHHILPPILADLRRKAPEIAVELVPSDATENLLFREADIALRMYRPEQLDVITRHLGDIQLGLYGAKSYLDRRGRPRDADALLAHDFVGYDRSDLLIRGMRAAGWQVDRDWFAMRCDHQTVYWELVRAGCGLGFGQAPIARADPTVEEVPLPAEAPRLPVWLTAHEKMRGSPRMRLVWDHLAAELTPLLS